MIVVSNTSPIFYLSTIGQLDLLRRLYNEILIPTAVFNEITNVGNTDASATIVPTLSWIQTQFATDRTLVNRLRDELDPGEAEVIIAFVQRNRGCLVVDPRQIIPVFPSYLGSAQVLPKAQVGG